MVTSIWCRDRLPAMHSSNGPLFHAGSSTKTPLAPIPRSAATSRTVQTPKARQVMNTVLEFRPAESPISCPRDHIAHVGMIRLKRLSSQARSAHHFPCVFGPSGNERCKLVNPWFPFGDCNGKEIGYGGPAREWGSCTTLFVAILLEHARSSHTSPFTLAQPHGSPVPSVAALCSAFTENDQRSGEPREQGLGFSASRLRF